MYNDYRSYIERKYHSTIDQFSFRDKKTAGWGKEDERIVFTSGKELTSSMHWNLDYFLTVYKHELIRDCCFKCEYARPDRESDITIGDFWGIDSFKPEMNDHLGVSLVIVHTQKGIRLFDCCSTSLETEQTDKEFCLQPNLVRPSPKRDDTDQYWTEYLNGGIEAIIQMDTPSLNVKLKRTLKKMLKMN